MDTTIIVDLLRAIPEDSTELIITHPLTGDTIALMPGFTLAQRVNAVVFCLTNHCALEAAGEHVTPDPVFCP